VALVVKNMPANAGNERDMGLIAGSGRSPEEGMKEESEKAGLKLNIKKIIKLRSWHSVPSLHGK